MEDAADFLSQRLAALTIHADPSVNVVELYPRQGRREPTRTLILDVARNFARRVPLTKLVELDPAVRPYLAALLAATIAKFKGDLIVPSGLNIIKKGEPEFTTWLKAEAGKKYDKYEELAG